MELLCCAGSQSFLLADSISKLTLAAADPRWQNGERHCGTCIKSHPLDCRRKSDPSPSKSIPQSSCIKQLKQFIGNRLYKQPNETGGCLIFHVTICSPRANRKVINSGKLLQIITNNSFNLTKIIHVRVTRRASHSIFVRVQMNHHPTRKKSE